jgi:hypothetical protein
MTTIATAIEKQEWEVVAVCLLRGFAQVASRLPPETLQQLLETLEGGKSAPEK